MKLPYRQNAYIPKAKLIEYLLSQTHAVGKFKAKFFYKLGFNQSTVSIFERALLDIAQSKEIKEELSTVYGTKYVIDGKINTPSNKTVKIRTIWILEKGLKKPRFITVYPV